MPRTEPFETHHERYEAWFERHDAAYVSELLALRGIETEPLEPGNAHGIALAGPDGPARVLFVERLEPGAVEPGDGETVVLTLDAAAEAPERCAVLDLLACRVHGDGGVVLESVRELCRKRGIRFEPDPWRYRGGLV